MSNYTKIADMLSNTEYSVLHGWRNLPDKVDGDLDIVINPNHLNRLEGSLLSSKEGKLVQLLQHESSCYFFIFAHKNADGTEFLQVDAATDYKRNGFTFFTADQFIRRRYKWNSFWVSSPDSEFPYLLVKKILKGEAPDHQKERFSDLVSELGIKKSKRIAAGLFGKRLGYRTVHWIYSENWDKFDIHLPRLRRALIWQELKKNPLNPIKYWLMEAKRIVLRWKYPTGLFVVVLGPDGSGKTTLIDSLQAKLLKAFRSVSVFHLRPQIFGGNKDSKPVTDPHGKPARSAPVSIIKIFYYISDYILGYLLKIHFKLVRSSLVIFDRYYDDLSVDPLRYRYSGGSWLLKFCRFFVPKPDLYLILDVNENDLLSRKQEVSIEELRRQRAAYRRLAPKLNNAHIVDGSADKNRVLNDSCEIIVNHLHHRYVDRRKLWFEDDPYNSLDWLNSVLSPDNKKTMFKISDSKKINSSSEMRTYKKFKFLLLKDGRGYLFPNNRKLYSRALDIYNVQSKKAKLFKNISKFTGGYGFTKTVRLMISKELKNLERNKIYFLEYIKKVLKRDDIDFSISLGTPGPDRKPVIQILSSTGEVVGFVKLGTDYTNNLIQNEANTVAGLSRFSSDLFSFPELIDKGWWQNRFFAVLSSPKAKPKVAPQQLSPNHIEVLEELADINTTWMTLDESPFWTGLNEKIESLKDNNYFYTTIKSVLHKIQKKLNSSPLPFHMSHGDFTPWNTYLVGEKLFIFDWEYSDNKALPGRDLFHFILQTDFFLNKTSPTETYNKILSGFDSGLESSYWKKIGIEKDQALAILILYVLDRLASLVSQEDKKFNELRYFSSIVNQFNYADGESF